MTSLRAKALIESENIPIPGKATITIKNPDLARVEVYGPLNQIITIVTIAHDNCLLYSNGRVRSCGKKDRAVYSAGLKELTTVLLGGTLEAGEGKDLEIVKDGMGRLSRFTKFEDGTPVVTVTVKDYKDVRGVEIPFAVMLESKEEKLLIEYYSVELNPEINNETFTLPLPLPLPLPLTP
ncbi:MAG: hypothetical protein HY883_07120 [Deltaproteobacteria bacterium]|nr:hypothetical protein [Deltaproteobacteria bacterium]